MQLVSKRVPKDHQIYLIGDFHIGTRHCDRKGLIETVQRIQLEENAYAIVGGDLIEAIMIDDPRYIPETVEDREDTPLLQYQAAREILWPIREKIITILMGNHDWKLARKVGNFVKNDVCKTLNVPFGTYTAKVTLQDEDGNLLYKIFYTHGAGTLNSIADDPTRRLANIQLSLKRRLEYKAADCIVMAMAHNHKLVLLEPIPNLYLDDNGTDVQQHYTRYDQKAPYIHPDHRFYISTGSFLKLYVPGISGYGELFNYDPHELGYGVVHARDGIVRGVEKRILHMSELEKYEIKLR